MEARAIAKYIRMSPYKVRRGAKMVRGKVVNEALNILHFSDIAASEPLEKVLRSAVSNFLNEEYAPKVSPEDLIIKELKIDGAYSLKRFKAGPMGRAMPRKKRTCHITVVVADKEHLQKTQ